ncbi:LuxR family transcriptional regulator [Pontixanthobacter sp. CEM42]|uniref:helix-turn-helix transcriptional regulator n=1 Tax=Pontixanthobacter sp. CEM42 TaxID=2792077 RepID=UPI001AE0CF94|nr:LuxR family transcriptional regulator [Pontixanthobacter sp. CEM42]
MNDETTEYWDALALVAQADGVVSYRRAILTLLKAVDYSAIYFLAPVVADRRVGRTMWNIGFPEQWESEYRARLHLSDPLPNIALNRSSAFRWSDAGKLAQLSDGEREYLTFIDNLKMSEGIAVHCTGPNARSGFVGVGLPKEGAAENDTDLRKVQVAAQLCFQRYCALVGTFGREIPDLSQRELDVIRWIGEGKSNAVIADILEISKSTVDSYVKRIFAKLDVTDRTTAAVRAVALGLIATGKHSRKQSHRPRWDG